MGEKVVLSKKKKKKPFMKSCVNYAFNCVAENAITIIYFLTATFSAYFHLCSFILEWGPMISRGN